MGTVLLPVSFYHLSPTRGDMARGPQPPMKIPYFSPALALQASLGIAS